jgi:membrane-associated phospholipid phosphatase
MVRSNVIQRIQPFLLISLYWLALLALGGLRGDHIFVGSLILIFCSTGASGRELLRFFLPFVLTFIVYDSQRFYSDYLRGPVHVSEPYNFDLKFFGIETANGVLTPNEWCQLHTHPILDLVTGFAYLVFFTVFILVSAYFVFYHKRKERRGANTNASSPLQSQVAARMPWAFFWLNVVGYTTYYWYAAAPPWYVALYGLGPAQMDVPANTAGCARFDQLLGTHFFTEMYGRSADVFGAIPSLHVAYPLLAVYFSFKLGVGRVFSTCFYLLMCFSAVYLNHHYILDILWGSAYALLAGYLINWFYDNQAYRQEKNKLSLETSHQKT